MKIFIFLLLFSNQVLAQSEYHFFSEDETRELNGPSLIGSEYQSDILAYTQPLGWYGQSLRAEQYFNFTAGSLGPTRFYTNNSLKIDKPLTDNLSFKVLYLDQASYEGIEKHFILEFKYKLNKVFALSIYGEPSSFKSSDDIGAAIITYFTSRHSLRLYATAVDFSYNERHEGPEKYKKSPMTYGLVGRWLPEDSRDEFVEYTLRHDARLHRNNPTTGRDYEFERSFFEIKGRYSFRPLHFINYQLSYKRGWEKDLLPTAPLPDYQWASDHITGLIQGERGPIVMGLKTIYRKWKSNRGIVIHNDLLPHIWYSLGTATSSFWRLGYEFTWHRGQGLDVLRSVLDHNNRLEHRFNLAYSWKINERAELVALFTADLDQFGTEQTWEGGNIQFYWNF